jgi:di- and tripeptidase
MGRRPTLYSRGLPPTLTSELTRQGGSIPGVRWLEKEFTASAVNFPMGQSSDNAHLVDERIRVLNLERGQKILQKVFAELSKDS